jgi:hypothetical protein
MMHAYDALGQLGGTGTTFLLGDYSKLPNWLFPKMAGFQTAPWLMFPTSDGAAATRGGKKTTPASIRVPVKKANPAVDDPYGD